jgi:hypothetical protein
MFRVLRGAVCANASRKMEKEAFAAKGSCQEDHVPGFCPIIKMMEIAAKAAFLHN